jgi:ribosomal protein L16 Arg81 hydroxylase
MRNPASTLEELVAPLTEAEFLVLLRERKLTLLRGANQDCYTNLLNWDALSRMIERGEYPRGPDHFRLSKESVMLPPDRWVSGDKADIAKVEDYLAQGYNITITHIEQNVPHLALLCDNIKSRLSEATYAGVIVTRGRDGAFRVHYDPEDLIILQIEGTKRWQIFGPAVRNPVRGMPKAWPPGNALVFDEVLQPGDLLFVPAGNWHHCEAGPGRSLHLGIFIIPPTGSHAVKALTSHLLSEEMFRMPLTRFDSPSEFAALEAGVKNRLIEKIGQLKLSEFLAEWSRKRSA